MTLDISALETALTPGSIFRGKLTAVEETDSTNTRLKQMAREGAPEGTVFLAQRQTGGRGTRGRAFHSPEGGLYCSVLLRPKTELARLLSITGWAASAVRRGIETASGAPAEIKWLNDVWVNGRKVCGILAELEGLQGDGSAECLVIGIGVNAEGTGEDFRRAGLEGIATSLASEGYPVTREHLCACILNELERMYGDFPENGGLWLSDYRAHCLTVGRSVEYGGNCPHRGKAEGINEDFSLLVREEGGRLCAVSSGTVTLL